MTKTALDTRWEFAETVVRRTVRVGRSTVRVTLGGAGLANLHCGDRDQRVKLFFPHPGQTDPVVPIEAGTGWFAAWRELDPADRAVMRTYTIADQRRAPNEEIDVDFVLHGSHPGEVAGPACGWAAAARPGDRLTVLGPAGPDNGGVDFRPPEGTDWLLIAADETALPATAGILRWLPAGARAKVWIEVPDPADQRPLPSAAEVEVRWLVRGDGPSPLADAVRAADLPEGSGYAWLAGESATVRGLRRHLRDEAGLGRDQVTFTGYWRRGISEEQLLAEALGAVRG